MKNENKNFKEEFKEWWSKNKSKIKIGAKCLGIGLVIGFFKGVSTMTKMHADTEMELIKKIPYEPDCDNIADYVHDHMDELKPFYEEEKEYRKEFDLE